MASRVYRVSVISGPAPGTTSVLQVVAADPADAERAVRRQFGEGQIVVDPEPLTTAVAEETALMAGTILLG